MKKPKPYVWAKLHKLELIVRLGIPESDIRRIGYYMMKDIYIVQLWNWRKIEITGEQLCRGRR